MMNETLQKDTPVVTESESDKVSNPFGKKGRVQEDVRIRWGTLLKYLLIAVVAMFLLVILMDKVIMPWYVKLGAVDTVPSVVGLTYADAAGKLQKLGFEVKKGEPRFDDRYPAGTVVMQLPYGGTQTKQGRRIYLTLSRGTEMIPMLDLLGMPLREARINLMRNGFEIGEMTYEHNDTMMKDLIYAQSVPPKVGARPGSVVDVMISRGPTTRFTMMPNLLSLDVDQARTRLENAGLVLGVIKYKNDPTYVRNTVIEQGVTPYNQVAQGAAVDITISGTADSEGAGSGDENSGEDEPSVSNLNTPPQNVPPPPKPIIPKVVTPKSTQKPAANKSPVKKPVRKPADAPVKKPLSTPPH